MEFPDFFTRKSLSTALKMIASVTLKFSADSTIAIRGILVVVDFLRGSYGGCCRGFDFFGVRFDNRNGAKWYCAVGLLVRCSPYVDLIFASRPTMVDCTFRFKSSNDLFLARISSNLINRPSFCVLRAIISPLTLFAGP